MFGAKPMKFYIKKLIKFNRKFKIIIKIKFSTNKNCKKLRDNDKSYYFDCKLRQFVK